MQDQVRYFVDSVEKEEFVESRRQSSEPPKEAYELEYAVIALSRALDHAVHRIRKLEDAISYMEADWSKHGVEESMDRIEKLERAVAFIESQRSRNGR